MPNTPALLGEGMTGVCYDPALFAKEEQETIRSLFESFGKMQTVEERLMNAVVCVSGSSPAYVYMFIEALADSAVKYAFRERQLIRWRPSQSWEALKWCLRRESIPER